MAEPLTPVQTIRYATYLKEAICEALASVFASHADPFFRNTKVTIETPFTEAAYPAIVVRFYERNIRNAGISHYEWFADPNAIDRLIPYRHILYTGDIEFAIFALSSYERDLLGDSVMQILTMGDIEVYTNQFLQRIYTADPAIEPASVDHMINVNTDSIDGMGESQAPAPWQPEDVLVYQKAYRLGVFGEVYSRTPSLENYGLVEKVDTFPYMPAAGEVRPEPDHPGPDGVYGTGDDQPDPAPWDTGSPLGPT